MSTRKWIYLQTPLTYDETNPNNHQSFLIGSLLVQQQNAECIFFFEFWSSFYVGFIKK